MVIVVIIVVVALLWASTKKDDAPKQRAPIEHKATAVVKKDAIAKSDGGDAVVLALRLGAEALVGNVFASKEAKAVATFGLGAAIAIGTVNVAAGIIVAIVVLFVATLTEIIAVNSQNDDHEAGITRFLEQRAHVKTAFEDAIRTKAAVANLPPNETELAKASEAYADGFMDWSNYTIVFRASQGSLFGGGISGGIEWSGLVSQRAVAYAWKKGLFASEQEPAPRGDALSAVSGWAVKMNGLSTLEPTYTVFSPPGPSHPYIAFPGMSRTWYLIGRVHANTAGFMQALKAPVGFGQNKYGHMVNSRNNGFFAGEVLLPPAIPAGIGCTVDGYTFYTPDDKSVIYTKVP